MLPDYTDIFEYMVQMSDTPKMTEVEMTDTPRIFNVYMVQMLDTPEVTNIFVMVDTTAIFHMATLY